ncbi:MAG: pro-sigmaK processing inhibitor BofA family protein [Lachnospiraceae bacterium]|nr:pro-sigmaK processing inhibitor BofA family protein [Lachnospiraceae bacterium]
MDYLIDIGMLAIAGLSIFLLIKLLAAPIKGLLKFALHAGLGLLILVAVNFIGGFFDFTIPFTWITVLVAGLGGIPGVILLVLIYLLIL